MKKYFIDFLFALQRYEKLLGLVFAVVVSFVMWSLIIAWISWIVGILNR